MNNDFEYNTVLNESISEEDEENISTYDSHQHLESELENLGVDFQVTRKEPGNGGIIYDYEFYLINTSYKIEYFIYPPGEVFYIGIYRKNKLILFSCLRFSEFNSTMTTIFDVAFPRLKKFEKKLKVIKDRNRSFIETTIPHKESGMGFECVLKPEGDSSVYFNIYFDYRSDKCMIIKIDCATGRMVFKYDIYTIPDKDLAELTAAEGVIDTDNMENIELEEALDDDTVANNLDMLKKVATILNNNSISTRDEGLNALQPMLVFNIGDAEYSLIALGKRKQITISRVVNAHCDLYWYSFNTTDETIDFIKNLFVPVTVEFEKIIKSLKNRLGDDFLDNDCHITLYQRIDGTILLNYTFGGYLLDDLHVNYNLFYDTSSANGIKLEIGYDNEDDTDYDVVYRNKFNSAEDMVNSLFPSGLDIDGYEDIDESLDFKYNQINESKETGLSGFEPYTCGYILPYGKIITLDEYHGEDMKLASKGFPEFSNTHPEEDTCVRIYYEPNDIQYNILEQIIDKYLDKEMYCKVEMGKDNRPEFYKVYSLYDGACEDCSGGETPVGNWTGHDIVKVIKNWYRKEI